MYLGVQPRGCLLEVDRGLAVQRREVGIGGRPKVRFEMGASGSSLDKS